jgi:hypothetical protein
MAMTAKNPKWSDKERREGAVLEILFREQFADHSVCYTFRATWYITKREYHVQIDPFGKPVRCTCPDGMRDQCWHQHELEALEAAYQSR